MKNVFKRNQIVISALAIMIAAAFYLNYAGKIDVSKGTEDSVAVDSESVDVGDISDEDIYAAANSEEVLDSLSPTGNEDIASYDLDLDGTDVAQADTTGSENNEQPAGEESQAGTEASDGESKETSQNVSEGEASTPGEAVLTSSITNVGFIAEAKLNREQVRAKNKEMLLEIINNTAIADDQKQSAIDTMISMTDISEREAAAETLLESKGFEDVVVSITGDSADVVVNMSEVTDAKRAQIEDIMKRKTGVPAENIVITPISVE